MARSPRQETIILAPGETKSVYYIGRWVTVLSNTAATVSMAFDGDGFTPVLPGISYPAADGRFDRVRFQDTSGAGCTIVVILSDEQAPDNRGNPLAAAMAASLASINQEISGSAAAAVAGQLADTVCPAVAPGVQLFAANPNRTEIEITADLVNGAEVIYLGITDARCVAVDKFVPLAAGDSWSSVREKGAIFATSSAGTGIVNGKEC